VLLFVEVLPKHTNLAHEWNCVFRRQSGMFSSSKYHTYDSIGVQQLFKRTSQKYIIQQSFRRASKSRFYHLDQTISSGLVSVPDPNLPDIF